MDILHRWVCACGRKGTPMATEGKARQGAGQHLAKVGGKYGERRQGPAEGEHKITIEPCGPKGELRKISGGGCRCEAVDRSQWEVVDRECNHSAFNGYRRTTSRYSRVRCRACQHSWRTKAAYVGELPDAQPRTPVRTDRATYLRAEIERARAVFDHSDDAPLRLLELEKELETELADT